MSGRRRKPAPRWEYSWAPMRDGFHPMMRDGRVRCHAETTEGAQCTMAAHEVRNNRPVCRRHFQQGACTRYADTPAEAAA